MCHISDAIHCSIGKGRLAIIKLGHSIKSSLVFPKYNYNIFIPNNMLQ